MSVLGKTESFAVARVFVRHTGEQLAPDSIRGRYPDPSSTWIPFFNGMTDAVRHLDFRVRGNDENGKVEFASTISEFLGP